MLVATGMPSAANIAAALPQPIRSRVFGGLKLPTRHQIVIRSSSGCHRRSASSSAL